MNTVRAVIKMESTLIEEAREFARLHELTLSEVVSLAVIEHLRRDPESIRAVCTGHGYTGYTTYPSGRDACIARFAFTFAILADMTPDGGHGERWCYDTIGQARAALEAWNGEHDTEPQGWHRHPATGRRRPDGDAAREYTAI